MQISFLGAAGTVTGSKYILSYSGKQILVDCGLFQGLKKLRLRNWDKFPVDPGEISDVILTHAHIDHSGYLPLLYRNGFHGNIFCTQGTLDLCSILLPDSGYLQEEEARYANKKGYSKHHPALPLYTQQDAENVLHKFVTYPLHQWVKLDDVTQFCLMPAGHIIGASFIHLKHKDISIVFSGDMGRPQDAVMKAPDAPPQADYVVLESTYGDEVHPAAHPCDELEPVINRTYKRGGTILIPAFAVGRAQAILYYIYLLKQQGRIPDLPVYLDSPMAISATRIMMQHQHEIRLTQNEIQGLSDAAEYVRLQEDSKRIDSYEGCKIIISASGMIEGGRILHHVKAFAPDEKNTILFTGYQAVETRGWRIMQGEGTVKMLGEHVPIRAEVVMLQNVSAHADSDELVAWLGQMQKQPKKIFLTHGEPAAALALQGKIRTQLGWNCVIPEYMQKESLG